MQAPSIPTCFVVMGFGTKMAYGEKPRTLDLDKSFRILIKPAVENAGLQCIRADDVVHSGIIDTPMYENLLKADIVVADLSTSNANAIYELGVRHALRPNTTIVIAESEFKFPFDLSHVLIRTYTHLGVGIDAEEADRFRGELQKAITSLLPQGKVDSPVYTFLPGLQPPALPQLRALSDGVAAYAIEAAPQDESTSALSDAFHKAKASSDWILARALLLKLRERLPRDSYIIQQTALATYKSALPDAVSALREARSLLAQLKPAESNDAETLGLWGAVHKRLWQVTKDRAELDEAIWAYEKGFYLLNDHYNGINYAYLLNVRSSLAEPADALTDFVLAERARRKVIGLCRERLAAGIKDEKGNDDRDAIFWLRATLVEALFGIGETATAEVERIETVREPPASWMADSLTDQLNSLQTLLAASPRRFLSSPT